jgi:ATP-binding cassette subfamily B multidrug efflux pump
VKKLYIYIKPYWKAALAAPLLMLIEVAADLMQPRLMAKIVDMGIATGNMELVIRTGLLMIGIALLGVCGGIGCMIFSSIVAQSFGTDLRLDLFKRTQSFSFASLDKLKTASLITRLTNDVVQVQSLVLMLLRIFVRAPFLAMGGMIMAMMINFQLALILIFAIPILAGALFYVIKKGFPLFSKVQKRLDKVNKVIQENLTGIRVVKAFARSDFENSRFGMANDMLAQINIKASRTVGLLMPLMILVMNLSIVAVLWFGGIKVNNGSILVGEVMAFINYMGQILSSLMMLGFMLMMASRAKVSADRIIEVLETETDIKDAQDAKDQVITAGRVDFQNVSFQYQGAAGDPVLKNISFTANPGETVAIIGSTGSGKSTLVNLIPRFYDVTAGSIMVDGTDIRELKLENLRASIGMVLQETILFSGTIKENIKWGRDDATDEEIIQAAITAQAHDFIMKLPEGYNGVLGQRGVNLSGGQKQRLAIARALLKKPVILILDDSTSALDLGTEFRLQQALKKYLTNTTCFVIAQRISSVLEADKILVLEDGQIAGIGRHEELIKNCLVYQDIYCSQMGEEEAV